MGAGANDRFRLTPVVAGLLAITVVSTVAAAAVMCALRVRSRRHRNQRHLQESCGTGAGSVTGRGAGGGGGAAVVAVCKQKVGDNDEYSAAAALDPDKNPDLIPPTKIIGESCLYEIRFCADQEEVCGSDKFRRNYIYCTTCIVLLYCSALGGSRGNNIGYRVVQQQPMGLNDEDDEDERMEATAESSDDERAGYPTFPVDGIVSRPSANSLRHVSLLA